MAEGETIHAGCVVVDEAGILIRGRAGAGKSMLACELVHAARQAGRFACLVSDDRTRIGARHGRLVAQTVAVIAGRIEVRGIGILPVPFETSAVVRLVIDLSTHEPPRLPEPDDTETSLCGVMVPRLRHRTGAPLSGLLSGLSCARDTVVTL